MQVSLPISISKCQFVGQSESYLVALIPHVQKSSK